MFISPIQLSDEENRKLEKAYQCLVRFIPREAGDIDPTLLTLTVIPDKANLNQQYLDWLQENYGARSYEAYEFLGDGIFDFIMKRRLFFETTLSTPHQLTQAVLILRSNYFFYCINQGKCLCDVIIDTKKTPPTNLAKIQKRCADVFEALIGIIFIQLTFKGYELEALNIIEAWLDQVWSLDKYIDSWISKKEESCFPQQPTKIKK